MNLTDDVFAHLVMSRLGGSTYPLSYEDETGSRIDIVVCLGIPMPMRMFVSIYMTVLYDSMIDYTDNKDNHDIMGEYLRYFEIHNDLPNALLITRSVVREYYQSTIDKSKDFQEAKATILETFSSIDEVARSPTRVVACDNEKWLFSSSESGVSGRAVCPA